MTLQNFCNMHYTKNGFGTVDVFRSLEAAQNYSEGAEDIFPELTICSDYQMRFVLHSRWYNAEVLHFYAMAKDHIAVVVRMKKEGRT